jgi:hypothetical protein
MSCMNYEGSWTGAVSRIESFPPLTGNTTRLCWSQAISEGESVLSAAKEAHTTEVQALSSAHIEETAKLKQEFLIEKQQEKMEFCARNDQV